jgi:hypothetical protein
MNSILCFVGKAEGGIWPQAPDLLPEQKQIESGLLQWSAALSKLATESSGNVSSESLGLLLVQQKIGFMFLKTCTTQYQTSFDRYNSTFRSVVGILERLLGHPESSLRAKSSFSLELGIIPCLFYTAIKCRHPDLRRRAIALLRQVPRRKDCGMLRRQPGQLNRLSSMKNHSFKETSRRMLT